MKRVMAAAIVAGGLAAGAWHVQPLEAQVPGVALAAFGISGDPFLGFVGPWRGTESGAQILYAVLCYETGTRRKVARYVTADIPDGTTLTGIRDRSAQAIIAQCAEEGITVPPVAVLLPSLQRGQ